MCRMLRHIIRDLGFESQNDQKHVKKKGTTLEERSDHDVGLMAHCRVTMSQKVIKMGSFSLPSFYVKYEQ